MVGPPENIGLCRFSSESSGDSDDTAVDPTSVFEGFLGKRCSKCSKVLEMLEEMERHLDSGRLDRARELLRELIGRR